MWSLLLRPLLLKILMMITQINRVNPSPIQVCISDCILIAASLSDTTHLHKIGTILMTFWHQVIAMKALKGVNNMIPPCDPQGSGRQKR
jgi:hypothetical protein